MDILLSCIPRNAAGDTACVHFFRIFEIIMFALFLICVI